jgi:methionine aminopeptidase type I
MVMIKLKSAREIKLMREAGKIVAEVLQEMERSIRVGITTAMLDKVAEKTIRKHGAEPAFLGYHNFPASICASVNDEVVHGIPGLRKLDEGDIISIDVGTRLKGYYGDAAATFAVGKISSEAQKLIDVTRTLNATTFRWCAAMSDTVSVKRCMKSHRCRILGFRDAVLYCSRAWFLPSSQWSMPAIGMLRF